MAETRLALVVDDNEVNRKLARAMLSRLDWQVDEADSGERALEKCQTQAFSLVLLDISMPGMSGETACVEMRKLGQPMRIIAYTAHAYPEEREKFMAVGFDDVLVKPVNRASLEQVLARHSI